MHARSGSFTFQTLQDITEWYEGLMGSRATPECRIRLYYKDS
jgi:hypothetical protein